MYYDLNILQGSEIQLLKHQIFIQISYWINFIPCNCAIVEWLTACRYSGFWQNEHVLSCFIVLVFVSKGSTYVSACIKLIPVRVLQFETSRALTIMLEVEGAMAEVYCISKLPKIDFSESIFQKEDLIKDF